MKQLKWKLATLQNSNLKMYFLLWKMVSMGIYDVHPQFRLETFDLFFLEQR